MTPGKKQGKPPKEPKAGTERKPGKSRRAATAAVPPQAGTPPFEDKETEERQPFPIVGIGASAGGLEALQGFFSHMPPDSGMAFVIIQHLDPRRKSIMDDLLRRYTTMPVLQVQDGVEVAPNSVYLNPPDKEVGLFKGRFQLTEPAEAHAVRLPIDRFFRSLAEDQGEKAICIILSGSGSDGTLGLRAIKGAGGTAVVQEPEQAQYGNMPESAIATGLVDYVLPVERMPGELIGYVKHPCLAGEETKGAPPEEFFNHVQKILMLVRSRTRHDFADYKQNTIRRRIERRMAVHKIAEIRHYVRYLQENPAEVDALFKDLIIGVTSFFRDPEALEVLGKDVIPALLEGKESNAPVRVWVPGCASGEEAYSIAVLFQEAMERLKRHAGLQIFATDIDPEALDRARAARYPESIAADVSPERLSRFFVRENGMYRVNKVIREMVVFALQNVVSDPPFSRLDLVSCRNLLIYMGPALQKKVIPLFHYTLNPGGYLFLGSSETIGGFAGLFSSVNSKWKVFQRKGIATWKGLDYVPVPAADLQPAFSQVPARPAGGAGLRQTAERIILAEYAPPCVLIDDNLDIVYFQGATDRYLTQPPGEPSFNILKMAREGLRHHLATALHKVAKERTPVVSTFQVKADGDYRVVDLTVRPVVEPAQARNLMLVTFEEKATPPAPVRKKEKWAAVAEADPRVASLEQELQSTREYLQAAIEELEASNEELKSANEELQSTNEELQSTNEELETSKEEMQSTNEELVTVNSELQSKVEELSQVTNDINNLLASTEIGTIFLDMGLKVKRFTPAMTKIFNLIPADVGRPLSDITSKISQGGNLYAEARSVLDTLQTKEADVQTENGSCFSVRMLPYRTLENMIDGVVISFVDMTERRRAEEAVQAARIYAESVLDTVREPLLVLDAGLKVVSANRSFHRTFKTSAGEIENVRLYDVGNGQWDIPELRELLEGIIPAQKMFDDFEVSHELPHIGPRTMVLNARMIDPHGAQPAMILLAIEDVTERKGKRE